MTPSVAKASRNASRSFSWYAATYAFFREGLAAARARFGVLEEPATRRALADFLRRGVDCGAFDADEL